MRSVNPVVCMVQSTGWLGSWFNRGKLQAPPGTANGAPLQFCLSKTVIKAQACRSAAFGETVYVKVRYTFLDYDKMRWVWPRLLMAESDEKPPSGTGAKRDTTLYPKGGSEDRKAWIAAWRVVGHHAWRLLDMGHLRAAARLAQVPRSTPRLWPKI